MSFPLRDYQKSLLGHLRKDTTPHKPGERLLVQVATGGGKTCVLNEFLRGVVARGDRALVVTKDWTLLAQAANDFTGRCGAQGLIGYVGVGTEPKKLFQDAPMTVEQPVVYSTIHSWASRADRDFLNQPFEFVLIDELHWGEGASLYSKLWERYESTSMFVGFTATPRRWTSFRLVDRPYDFAELLNRGILARPVVIGSTQTNINWAPRLTSAHGDISPSSLNELATSEQRNRLIVRTYNEARERFGKTLVFACNIDHAEVLANIFRDSRVRAEALHHKLSTEEKLRIRQDFEGGRLDVLVNVTMFTHGVDIPKIQSIFLARPTTSDILFSQMIGRGSRRISGEKDTFNVLDFVDSVSKHGIPIIRPEGFLGSVALTRNSRGAPIEKHAFKPSPMVSFPDLPGYEEIHGFDIQPEQTFGIEFEASPKSGSVHLSPAEYNRVSRAIMDALDGVVPISGFRMGQDNTSWYIKTDNSCGLEITTRILKGMEGFIEVYDVLKILHPLLDRLGYRVGVKTGTHVHLGWKGVPFNTLKRLMSIIAYYEPAFHSLIAPSRVQNQYAKSVRGFFKKFRLLSSKDWRFFFAAEHYLGVSLQPIWRRFGTVEVRMHNGTLEAQKILAWVSLWMRVMDKAYKPSTYAGDPSRRLARSPLCPGPRGDISHLADFVGVTRRLKEQLLKRREYVIKNSWLRHTKYGKLSRTMLSRWHPEAMEEVKTMAPLVARMA